MNINYDKCDEAVKDLREKLAEAETELKKQEHLVDYYGREIDKVWNEEIARQYAQPFVPTSTEDETPDNDNPFQGREDDEKIIGSHD